MTEKQPEPSEKQQSWSGTGLVLGVSVGVSLGVALDNLALCVAIGTGVGVALGGCVSGPAKSDEDEPKQ